MCISTYSYPTIVSLFQHAPAQTHKPGRRMLKIQVSQPSPDANPQHVPTLADLSRNASVISSSSSSSSVSDLTVQTPVRPRPTRTFSSPRIRSKSPQSPSTPRGSKPPAYLARELGIAEDPEDKPSELKPPASRAPSRSRNSSVNGRISANDFEFGRVLGEGSYSEVRPYTASLAGGS